MPNEQGHILVVDDYAMNRMKLSRFLQQQGHTVTLAEHGKQAVEMINEQPFDLMLLDIEMPEMDGYEVLEYMKQHDMLRNLPVIVISASDEMESVIKQQRLQQQVQELRIELNEARQNSQVAEITETDYFRDLQDKAKDLRSIMEEGDE